jgi:glucose-6-phosphate 1-epimerase
MELANPVAELNRRFGIPGVARVVAGNGGLAKLHITSPAATGEMYLHGAHVTAWKPRDAEEVLFVSVKSHWENGRAIRGGVPICFPWFANKANDPHAPAHGFVRTTTWQLESIVQAGDAVSVNMFTESNDNTRRWWPADFRLVHRATFGTQLSLELVATNTGSTSLQFEEALHTYFRVGQVEKTQLHGLDTVHFVDKTDSNRMKAQKGPIVLTSETDRVYLNTKGSIALDDHALRRRIDLTKENSFTTVVWNPWALKSRAITDFDDAEWRQMLCIEASNVADFAVMLAPGQQHRMKATVQLADF